MTAPPGRRQRWRGWQEEIARRPTAAVFGGLAVATLAVIGEVGLQVAGNELAAHLTWLTVPAVVVAALAASVVVAYVLRRRESQQPEEPEPPVVRLEPLPPRVDLVGRASVVNDVAARARQDRVVLVHGPSGMGVSAVAIEAARKLAPEQSRQVYVDLSGQSRSHPENARRIAVRVLTILGLPVGRAANSDRAAAALADRLRDSGRVVVLDNAVLFDQVEWATGWVPGAHLIIAGDVGVRAPHPGLADVPVGPLDPASALDLLRRQDGSDSRRHRVRARIDAESDEAYALARDYLKQPRVAIQAGRWLAENPEVSIRALREDLAGAGDESEALSAIRYIFAQQLGGASTRARRLMALLVPVPIDELPEDAIAALAGQSAADTAPVLDELVQRSLLTRVRPTRYRLPDEVRRLGHEDAPLGRALVRLTGWYAALAGTHARALSPASARHEEEEAARWLRTEDTALLQVLWMPSPEPEPPPREAGPSLWRIADALDTWFSWQNRPADRRAAAEAMLAAAQRLADPTAQETALLRLAALARADFDLVESGQLLAEATQLAHSADRPQLHVGLGLRELAVDDLDAANRALEAARKLRPRRDVAGRIIDLTNLAVVLLSADQPDGEHRLDDPHRRLADPHRRLADAHRRLDDAHRRLDDAHRRLSEALDLATSSGDLAGEAHARELLGIVAGHRQNPDEATWAWQQAQLRYEQLNDDLGQARCLLHGGMLRLSRPDCGPAERAEAESLIQQSIALRGDDARGIGPALAHLHLAESAAHRADAAAAAKHGAAAVAALVGWPDNAPRPPLLRAIDARLAALAGR